MNHEQHRFRHIELHRAFDELLGDFLSHSTRHSPRSLLSDTSILELLQWSHQQTIDPAEIGKHDDEVTP